MDYKKFIMAGKAIFTVSNGKGDWFTYRVSKGDEQGVNPVKWFVHVLTGPNNMRDYTYIGVLDSNTGTLRHTKASRFDANSTIAKVFNWAVGRIIWQNRMALLPQGYGIKHEGRCGRCGRLLTTPESIDNGIGPECLGRIGNLS